MNLLWPDLRIEAETMIGWKLKGLHAARFFGLRDHPIHEICLACGKVVDFPISRRCTECGAYQDRKNPMPQRHNGLDLAKPRGTSIGLPWEGRISSSYFDPKLKQGGHGGGWSLTVEHPDGLLVARTGYCHMDVQSPLLVGRTYPEGTYLGKVGSSGDATGPHLHWTCRNKAGELIDPLEVLMIELALAEVPWHSVG